MVFEAIGEDGRKVQLQSTQDSVDAGTRGDPGASIPGLKQLWTSDGQKVSRDGKGKYSIVQTGEVLTSNDPDAP